jgi:hypothetical protein
MARLFRLFMRKKKFPGMLRKEATVRVVSSTIDNVASEIHLTATDWAKRSGLPYRAILKAIKDGDLIAYRPAGSARGSLYIAADDFRAWLDSTRVAPTVPQSITRRDYDRKQGPTTQLSRLRLGS